MQKLSLLSLLCFLFSTSVLQAQHKQDSLKNYNLQGVTVTATRMGLQLKNVPQKVEIIDKLKIQSLQTENAADLLKKVTNADIIQYPGLKANIGMRGFSPTAHARSYTLVLIDGKPSGTSNLATIPTDIIESIEVVKGPYSALYGSDAMSGVVNIITKKPDEFATAKINTSFGSCGQTQLNVSASAPLIKDKLFLALGTSRNQQTKDYRIGNNNIISLSEKEKNMLDKKSFGDIMHSTKYEMTRVFGKLDYKINNIWNANISSFYTTGNDIELANTYWHTKDSKKDMNRFSLYGEVQRTNKNNTFSLAPYFNNDKTFNYNTLANEAFVDSKEAIKQYGVKLQDAQNFDNLKLLLGLDFDFFDVASQRFSKKTIPTTPYRPDNTRANISAFTQASYTWKNLYANAGLRYDYIRYKLEKDTMLKNEPKSENYSNINPSAGIKYFIIPELNVHASFGTAFYVPDAYKVAGVYKIGNKNYVGNKNLNPETNTSFDIGLNYSKDDRFNADVSFFQNYYNNKIVTDSKKDTVTYKNAGNARMNGLEVMASSNIAKFFNANFKVELYANFTFIIKGSFDETFKTTAKTDSIVTRNIVQVRRANGNFGVYFDNYNGFSARLHARYIGSRLENDYNNANRPDIKADDYYTGNGYTKNDKILQHPQHMVFDYSIFYNINKNLRIGLTLSNLFDENYTEKDGYNMPGRSLMGHLSYTF